MSETPRTDEHIRRKKENGHVAVVSIEFARQLETELADKEKQLAEARADIERLKQENGILKRCLKHEQELSRKMQDRITELEDLWLLQKNATTTF